MSGKRVRRVYSVERELVTKAREAALAAVQIFNNPQIHFKSELFIVTMNIAWTYLMHAYYRKSKMEYCYHQIVNGRKRFDKTKHGARKSWVLETCITDAACPLDKDTKNNLFFLIGIRHEVEHQMTSRIDPTLSAKFQACCLNFNRYLKQFFGDENGIDKHLSFSLQFSSISQEQVDQLSGYEGLPGHISAYITAFESGLTEEEFNNQAFAYRVFFVPKLANHKGQADEVIEFIKADSELANQVNKAYTVVKETEKEKFLPGKVVELMKAEGYTWFGMQRHTDLWQSKKARDLSKGYGCWLDGGKTWRWYKKWVDEVRKWCVENDAKYKVDA